MPRKPENEQDNMHYTDNKIIPRGTVIACSADGYACLVEDIEQTSSVIVDAASINAPPSGPSVGASDEVVESAGVIVLSATGFQPPAGSVSRSSRLLENAAAVGQLSPDETQPPRAPSRSGATFMNLVVNSDEPEIPGRDVGDIRTTPPEPMKIDDDPTVAPISNSDSNNDSSADKVEVSPRSNISTCESDKANANTPGNEVREEQKRRREGRTKGAVRNASSNSDRVYLCRMQANTRRNLRSNLRNIADGNVSSLVCTPKAIRGNTYRSRRDAQKTKNDALRAKTTATRNVPSDETSLSSTGVASDMPHRSTRSTAVASGRVTRSTSSASISNPCPTTKTPTTSTRSKSPDATFTFTPCHATITFGPDGEASMLVATSTGTSSSGALPRSNNGKTHSTAAALADPPSPNEAVEMLTFPAEITFEGEVIGEATAEIRGAMVMPVSPSFTDHESDKKTSGDSNVATNVTFPSGNNTGESASDTIVSATTNTLVMDSDNITLRPLSPAVTLPSMPSLGTTQLSSVDSASTIDTTPSSDELASNVSADGGENEKSKQERKE